MRRWIAALAFVPALAWGDCGSPEMRESVMNLAEAVQERREQGESYQQATRRVRDSGGGEVERRLYYTVVDGVYGGSSMQAIWQTTYAACVTVTH